MYSEISVILLLRAALCLATLVIEEQPNNENSFFNDEHKSKLKDIISNYKYDASKQSEGTADISNSVSQCLNIFKDKQQKGWSSLPSSTCVTPGNQCTIDYRNITEITMKYSNGLIKDRGSISPNPSKTPGGWNSNAWSQSSSSSSTNKTCCNQDICTNGFCCTPAPASSTHSICKTNSHCCGFMNGISQCSTTLGICLLTLGTSCNSTNQCISGICDGTCCYPTGTCMPADVMCTSDKQCCGNGVCMDGRCLASEEESCCADSDCVSPNKCIMGTCTACANGGSTCSAATPCCPGTNSICNSMTNICGNCQAIGGSCTSAPSDTCCSGGHCSEGNCVKTLQPNGGNCQVTSDCESPNTCPNGICCLPLGAHCAVTIEGARSCCSQGCHYLMGCF